MSENKVLKYFGANYCRFSNTESRVYNLINGDLKSKYPDLDIQIYMSDDTEKDNTEEFKNANVNYVPIITNSKNEVVDLKIADDVKLDEHSDEELHELLLKNIYNQIVGSDNTNVIEEFNESNNNNLYLYIIIGIIAVLLLFFLLK